MTQPNRGKGIRQYFNGLSVWAKIGWMIVLGSIVGRIIYWLSTLT